MENMLNFFKEIKEKIENERKNSKNSSTFNIFSVLRNEHDEVNLHSKFISELFNDNKYGKKFLKQFLDDINLSDINFKEKKVLWEKQVNIYSRIDILVKLSDEFGNKKVIIIENKIYADDQSKQLERYYTSFENQYKKEEIIIIYLTLDGRKPSDDSLGEKLNINDIYLVSYEEHILKWIKNCITICINDNSIAEILKQYILLINKITGKGDQKMIEEIKNIILEKNYFKNMNLLKKSLIEVEIELQTRFWKKLEEKILKKFPELKRFNNIEQIENNFNYSDNGDFIKDFYYKGKNNRYYGLMYQIRELENSNKLFFRIEIEHQIYYGFRIINDKKEYSHNKKFADRFRLEEKNYKLTDWWLGWKYFEYNGEEINFKYPSQKLINTLGEDEKLDEMTDIFINNIEEALRDIKKYF